MPNDISDVLEENLNDSQRAAATDNSSEVICLACAGSGKSRTLAYRIARLIAEGYEPEEIVAFTFSRKAAESIKRRVSQALEAAGFDPTMVGAMFIGTIHSYCLEILREIDAAYQQFDPLDGNRLKLYLISRYPELELYRLRNREDAHYFETIREVASAWRIFNDEMLSLEEIAQEDRLLAEVLNELRVHLLDDQFLDFSAMVRLAVDAFRNDRQGANEVGDNISHTLVDEYQDVVPVEEALIQELNDFSETLFVVGDDDQAIYGWRGSDVRNIIDFEARHPGCGRHTLSRNYRSTESIVTAADNFIHDTLGPSRVDKEPESVYNRAPRDLQTLHFDDRPTEAEWVANRIEELLGTEFVENDGTTRGLTPADFAILMRSTAGTEQTGEPRHAAFTNALDARDIPFSLTAGGSIFDRPQVNALYGSFELLRDDPPSRREARRFFNNHVNHPEWESAPYPHADFGSFAEVLSEWGRQIHTPAQGPRRRVYPQQLVHDLLEAFGLPHTDFGEGLMQDIGTFSRIIQDVESVYVSIDSSDRFEWVLNFLDNVARQGYDSESNSGILRRPDAVTVSTVHKAKGLEFPAVFVVDAQQGRFPKRRSNYNGWIPESVIEDAIHRGAYQSTRPEEARLFYTATTRAERFLYVTGCGTLPGGERENNRSEFALRLDHEERGYDGDGVSTDLESHPQVRRENEEDLPTSFSEIRHYLRCPKDFQYRKLFGFSPPIPPMFGFGRVVHSSIGRLHQEERDEPPSRAEAENQTEESFHLKHVPQSSNPETDPGPYERAQETAQRIVGDYVEEYGDDFSHLRQVEASFEIPVDSATISGSIDLLLEYDDDGNIIGATVIDFKTMEGGEEPLDNPDIDWTDLALQVQLYARAATEVLGREARTGSIHLLKDNQRIEIPIDEDAVEAAIQNVEWSANRILGDDFPMRPSEEKCAACDFQQLCSREVEDFESDELPPPIHLPEGRTNRQAQAIIDVE